MTCPTRITVRGNHRLLASMTSITARLVFVKRLSSSLFIAPFPSHRPAPDTPCCYPGRVGRAFRPTETPLGADE